MRYTLGIDYGTNSVRAIVVDVANGDEIGSCVYAYPSGNEGILEEAGNPHLARQNPQDYLSGLEASVLGALKKAQTIAGFSPDKVIGIGVDTTGSSPIPVDAQNVPLACKSQWSGNLSAQCWLWKDHTSIDKAQKITDLAKKHRPAYLAKCGMTYSSEWFWSKIWHCLEVDPEVFHAAYSWVELSDFIPAILAGEKDPRMLKRGICAAGHKALYCDEWGGLPDKDFLNMLAPELADLRDRLYEKAHDANTPAGKLCSEWSDKLGIPQGIPVAIGEFDVHYGAIGSGVREGTLVKAIGTSSCDCAVIGADKSVEDIPGICGIVKGAILPGYYGIEAGQSAVGDIFKWFVQKQCNGDEQTHIRLTQEASELKPGESGLLALDWHNGNRTVLVDPLLTGAIIGQTLHTTQAEVYRALIEASAFGARMILERMQAYGITTERIVCCGGIAEKNAMLMQIYADVTGCEMQVSRSSQSCALGSAIAASVIAGAHEDFETAMDAMTGTREKRYTPNAQNKATYNKLFSLYQTLHDAFGGVSSSANLGHVMKALLDIKKQQNA